MKSFVLGPLAALLAGVLCAPWVVHVRPDWARERETRAGTALHLDTQGLVDASALVVEGRVLSAASSQGSDGVIDTEYVLEVGRTFLGAPAPVRSVRLPGGVLEDGRGLLLPGLPHLAVGEDVILFLTDKGPGERRMPVGLSQGKLRVVPDPDGGRAVIGELAGTALVDPELGGHLPATHTLRTYAEVSAEIQAAVERRLAREAESMEVR